MECQPQILILFTDTLAKIQQATGKLVKEVVRGLGRSGLGFTVRVRVRVRGEVELFSLLSVRAYLKQLFAMHHDEEEGVLMLPVE